MNVFLITLAIAGALAAVGLLAVFIKRRGDPPVPPGSVQEKLEMHFPKRHRTHPRKDKKTPRNKRTMKRVKGRKMFTHMGRRI